MKEANQQKLRNILSERKKKTKQKIQNMDIIWEKDKDSARQPALIYL